VTARFKSLFDSSQRDEKFREQERARALATLRTCLPLPDVQLASGAAREAEQVVTGMERTEMCAKMVVGVSGRGRAGKGGGRGSPEVRSDATTFSPLPLHSTAQEGQRSPLPRSHPTGRPPAELSRTRARGCDRTGRSGAGRPPTPARRSRQHLRARRRRRRAHRRTRERRDRARPWRRHRCRHAPAARVVGRREWGGWVDGDTCRP